MEGKFHLKVCIVVSTHHRALQVKTLMGALMSHVRTSDASYVKLYVHFELVCYIDNVTANCL